MGLLVNSAASAAGSNIGWHRPADLHQVHLLVGFSIQRGHFAIVIGTPSPARRASPFDLGSDEKQFSVMLPVAGCAFCLYETAQVAGLSGAHAEDCVQFVVVLDHHSRTQLCLKS
jgi:hypothetical protein